MRWTKMKLMLLVFNSDLLNNLKLTLVMFKLPLCQRYPSMTLMFKFNSLI
jgi:hypothetical protein